ncbi:MAG: hypothetical protein GY938_32650 [Ketobacter sp.]|nr:hypothetical protein [Ketobacter sp.]
MSSDKTEFFTIPAFLRRPDSKEHQDWMKKVRENIRRENEDAKREEENRTPTREQMLRSYDL